MLVPELGAVNWLWSFMVLLRSTDCNVNIEKKLLDSLLLVVLSIFQNHNPMTKNREDTSN